ncbi:MAG TPA: hypothetical protein DCL77_15395 [Prolixibacteraceae bacterium]|jgi:hypothetical protein|nr:hypothetical protein [Prolixibacteraceae bacterium]
MKKLIFYLSVGFLFSFLAGCDWLDDTFDNQNSRDNAWIGFGLIQKDTVDKAFTIELDNGAILFPETNGWYDIVANHQRVLANYTITGTKQDSLNPIQYYVKINSLRNILYKGILDITPAMEDSIGHDPIHVKDHWLKDNMLNFELSYLGGSKIHYINLVREPGASATEPVVLQLRHNANSDPDMIRLSAVVTFDLSSLKVAGKDSVTFKVVSKDFNGDEFGYTGVYKY